MNYYLKREHVNHYTQMVNGEVNEFIIDEIRKQLADGSTLLELGMGTGAELIHLSQYYKVLGSDYSPLFLDDFKKKAHWKYFSLMQGRSALIDLLMQFIVIKFFSNLHLQNLNNHYLINLTD